MQAPYPGDAGSRPLAIVMSTELHTEHNPVGESGPAAGTRRIRSFVRRAGRITLAQERALQHDWPRYGIDLPSTMQCESALDLHEIFGRDAPKVLEIGFGNGDTLLNVASQQPERDFLGIEVHRAGVGRLLHEAARLDLGNLKLICHDAVDVLAHHLNGPCLDEVWILFPDHWHKARHHKRRLIQDSFIELLASRMREGALLHLATDWQPYAEHMLEVMSASARFRNLAAAGSSGYVTRPDWRPLTRFERRGQRLGHGVWDLGFARTAD